MYANEIIDYVYRLRYELWIDSPKKHTCPNRHIVASGCSRNLRKLWDRDFIDHRYPSEKSLTPKGIVAIKEMKREIKQKLRKIERERAELNQLKSLF